MAEGNRKRVLFVDDEAVNLLCARSLFRRTHEVYTATSAAEALGILERTPMDAVVSDQRMPGMTGTELFAKLDSREGLRVILTGYSADEEIKKALSDGVIDAVLDKPLDPGRLFRALGWEPAR